MLKKHIIKMTKLVAIETISYNKITYKCPFCVRTSSGRIYDANTCKYKQAVPTIHKHGNEEENVTLPVGWFTFRTSHCSINNVPVQLVMTDQTVCKFGRD